MSSQSRSASSATATLPFISDASHTQTQKTNSFSIVSGKFKALKIGAVLLLLVFPLLHILDITTTNYSVVVDKSWSVAAVEDVNATGHDDDESDDEPVENDKLSNKAVSNFIRAPKLAENEYRSGKPDPALSQSDEIIINDTKSTTTYYKQNDTASNKQDYKCKHMFEWSMMDQWQSSSDDGDKKDFFLHDNMNNTNLPQTKHLSIKRMGGPSATGTLRMTIVLRSLQLKTMVVDLSTQCKDLKSPNVWHRHTVLYCTWVAVQIAQRRYNLVTDRVIYVHDCRNGELPNEWRNVGGELSCNRDMIHQADVTLTPPTDGLLWDLPWDFNFECFGSEMFSAYASMYTDKQSELDPTDAMGCWIDRQTARTRRVANLDDVLSTMREVFPRVEVITFTANKSGNETAEMIKECRVLFGVHGAGHTNAIYARPGVAVIEAIGTINPAYYRNINMLLDQNYQSIIGDRMKKITDTNWTIDLDEAKAALIKAKAHTDEWIKEHGHWRV